MNSEIPAGSENLFDVEKPWGECKPQGLEQYLIKACHSLPATPALFYTLNKGLRRKLKNGDRRAFDVEVLALKLRLINRGNYCETTALLAPQFYDRQELSWLGKYLAAGDVFLDIGGNIGLYSLVAASTVNGLRVFTVEPDPSLSTRMGFNATTNHLDIHHCNTALSDYEGQGQLDTDARQSGENSLHTSKATSESASKEASGVALDSQGLNVNVTTLHTLCLSLRLNSIEMMKIDIEGHEHRVLSCFFKNAPRSLWPKRIIIEHVHDKDQVIPLLIQTAGYNTVETTKRNSLLSLD